MNDDQELVAGVHRRDPEAFHLLMEQYAGPVVNLAYRFLGIRADAEEIAQEVFLRLYQHPPHLNPQGKLFTWLYRVTVNRSLDLLRSRRSRPPMLSLEATSSSESEEGFTVAEKLPDISAPNPREQVAQKELAILTRKAVAALPEELRLPLILATFEELSYEAIAQILGTSSKAIERRLYRARALLKARLAPHL